MSATDLARTGQEGGEPARNLETRIWLGVLAVHGEVFNRLNRVFVKEFDITVAKFDVLAQLHRFSDGLTLGTLSRHLKVTGGNVTGLVRRLAADGLVTREMSPQDRRTFIVRLTPEGSKRFKAARDRHDTLLREWFAAFPLDELDTVHASVARLRQHFVGSRSGEQA